jgi:hypothetical protein
MLSYSARSFYSYSLKTGGFDCKTAAVSYLAASSSALSFSSVFSSLVLIRSLFSSVSDAGVPGLFVASPSFSVIGVTFLVDLLASESFTGNSYPAFLSLFSSFISASSASFFFATFSF